MYNQLAPIVALLAHSSHDDSPITFGFHIIPWNTEYYCVSPPQLPIPSLKARLTNQGHEIIQGMVNSPRQDGIDQPGTTTTDNIPHSLVRYKTARCMQK